MIFHHLLVVVIMLLAGSGKALKFNVNPSSTEILPDETLIIKADSDESAYETELDGDEIKEKKLLDDAMKIVLDPNSTIPKNKDSVEMFKFQLEEFFKDNITMEEFINEMDKLTIAACKAAQEALWSYVVDFTSEKKKTKMMRMSMEEDEIKKKYWENIKKKYLVKGHNITDPVLKRKLRILKVRGLNIQLSPSKQKEDIDMMQRIWSRAIVCSYNATNCNMQDSVKTMSGIMTIFKTSHDSKELMYYWKAYRDVTGRKIRPIYKKFVDTMNSVAKSENFADAGEMWRYVFEDDDLIRTVNRLWKEIKPLYRQLCLYVRGSLKSRYYPNDFNETNDLIPAHLFGNLWAQEWQIIYSMVTPYPQYSKPKLILSENIQPKDLLNSVDEFYISLGFESASDAYQDMKETMNVNCLPSSHDMCDGINYKIKWCDQKITDINFGLSHAARLLGHVQYFKHYRNLSPLFQDGPNPAFHEAVSDIMSLQLTSPSYLKGLSYVKASDGPEVKINHLMWVALEKLPLTAYAYILDKWRWDIFGNSSLMNWNQHWWDLRIQETGVSPPVPRNESDLDPAAKYHVVSHMQYITYMISHVLEFQILRAMCKKANHTGPLHECSLKGARDAGKLLSDGMSLGASKDWRTVLEAMTGERDLSTKGMLEYFSPLHDFLKNENMKSAQLTQNNMDQTAPIIVGSVVVILTIVIVVFYIAKKPELRIKVLSICGLTKNGSMDIETNDISSRRTNVAINDGFSEDKM